jgi:hypothetical protein
MTHTETRVVAIRHGRVQPSGSWVYVWLDIETGDIAYVGATAYEPALRAHLHLENDDPQLGRVRATVDRYAERDFDVLVFEVPADVDRGVAKRHLEARLRSGVAAGRPAGADVTPTDGLESEVRSVRNFSDDVVRIIAQRRAAHRS